MYILIPSAQDIQSGIITALRTFLMHLCEAIYKLIIFCFNIFEGFGNIRLFENSDVIAGIYNRIGLILGLFMIFRISFSAIEYIINPDNILDKSKGIGNIVKRVIIVIVLLGSTRFLFDFAYDVQERLIDSKIVSKVILSGSTVSSNADSGADIAWYAFSSFYQINPDFTEEQIASDSRISTCDKMLKDGSGTIYTNFHNRHSLSAAYYCLNQETTNDYTSTDNPDPHKENVIEFNGVFCLAVGIFLLWTIFTYTVQAGVRIIQLAYLELIAPIPIMLYLTPSGDDKLMNWGKQCLTTFLDFFIRLAIMDFIIIVSQSLIELRDNIFGYFSENSVGTFGSAYIIIILIIALMIFAKRIPSLIQEILPSMGGAGSLGFGFGATGEAKKVGGFLSGLAGRTVGATAGGVVNAGVSAIDRGMTAHNHGRNVFGAVGAGLLSGGAAGIRNGLKKGSPFKNFGAGWNDRRTRDKRYEDLMAEGGSAIGVAFSKIRSNFGETPGQYLTRQMEHADKINEYQKQFFDNINQVGDVKMWTDAAKEATIKEGESVEAFAARKRMYEENAQNAREALARALEQGRSMDDIRTNGLSYDFKEMKEKTRTVLKNGVLTQEKYLEEGTSSRNFNILKDDDKFYSGASASIAETNDYITSHHVKVNDGSGFKDMATIGSGEGKQSFKEAGKAANESKKNISKSGKYQRAKANDKGAGLS